MANVSNVDEIKGAMDDAFDASAAAGMDTVFQFELTGDGGDEFWVHVKDGSFEKGEGMHDDPDCTVTAGADDYIKLVNGDLAAMSAVMMGKVKIKGDMGLAMKLQSVFDF